MLDGVKLNQKSQQHEQQQQLDLHHDTDSAPSKSGSEGLNFLSVHLTVPNAVAVTVDFSKSFAHAVLHPLEVVDSAAQKDASVPQDSAASRAGALAGQMADAFAVLAVAAKLHVAGVSKIGSSELMRSGKAFPESFLHAPVTLDARQTAFVSGLKPIDGSFVDRLHIDPVPYDMTQDASHLIESTRMEKITYKSTNPYSEVDHLLTTEDFKFYKLKGLDTQVGLPVSFAHSLEKIRETRKIASDMEGFERDKFDTFNRDNLHGYDSAILPEQMLYFLRELPNPSLVKELLLIPEADFRAGAAVDLDLPGRMQIFDFKKFLDPYIDTAEAPFYLRHEWSHLADQQGGTLSGAFRIAHKLEINGFFADKSAKGRVAEDWAVHLGENLIDPNALKFYETVEKAPMRSLVLLQSLKQQLSAGEADAAAFLRPSNPYSRQLHARVEFGEQVLIPRVRDIVADSRKSVDPVKELYAIRYQSLLKKAGLDLSVKLAP